MGVYILYAFGFANQKLIFIFSRIVVVFSSHFIVKIASDILQWVTYTYL